MSKKSISLKKRVLLYLTFCILIPSTVIGILSITVLYYIYIRIQINKPTVGLTVDAIIEDKEGNVVLIKRKYPPFQNYYALPGGFIKEGEKPVDAVIREVKEETNLDIKIIKKIGVFDKEERDPRGRVISTAFLCQIIGDTSNMKSGTDSAGVDLIPRNKIKMLDLAFDHREILEDADIID